MADIDEAPKKKKSETRQRHRVLRCRVLPSESEEIGRSAKAMNMTVSALLRESALDRRVRHIRKRIPSLEQQQFARLTGQLGKVGAELNKIFSIVQREGCVAAIPALQNSLTEFHGVLGRLTSLLE